MKFLLVFLIQPNETFLNEKMFNLNSVRFPRLAHRHYCYLFTYGELCNSSLQTAFLRKCKCVSANELTRILLRPNVVCSYEYCTVYMAVFGAFAATMHFQQGRTTLKIAPSPGGSWTQPNNGSLSQPESTTQTAS